MTEPLSNFPPDHTSLTLHLTRSGDTSHTSIVHYSTVEDTALAGVDFVMNASHLTFPPGENTSQVMVQVLANHARDADSTFLVVLRASDPNTTISHEGGQARVVVHNQPVTGVYFPDLPVVVSLLEDGGYQSGNMDPNLPLACITVSVVTHVWSLWLATHFTIKTTTRTYNIREYQYCVYMGCDTVHIHICMHTVL